jgi:sulfate permease, SulP family
MTMLGQVGPEEFHSIQGHPEARAIPGVVIYRFSGPLFFANCEFFRARAEKLI